MRCLKHSGRFVFVFFVIIGMIAAGDKVRCGNLSGTLRRLLFPQEGSQSEEVCMGLCLRENK